MLYGSSRLKDLREGTESIRKRSIDYESLETMIIHASENDDRVSSMRYLHPGLEMKID